jgi:hypothetical protein
MSDEAMDTIYGLDVPALPAGAIVTGVIAVIEYLDADGDEAVSIRGSDMAPWRSIGLMELAVRSEERRADEMLEPEDEDE